MRKPKNFYATSAETVEVLKDCVEGVAKAYGCSPQYIYGIRSGAESDPYPPLREWAQTCANGGADLTPYITDLQSIDHQAKFGSAYTNDLCKLCFEQISKYAERIKTLAAIVADGKADERETEQILAFCTDAESEIKKLREIALSVKTGFKETRKIFQRQFERVG
jgi:hypothetical protein